MRNNILQLRRRIWILTAFVFFLLLVANVSVHSLLLSILMICAAGYGVYAYVTRQSGDQPSDASDDRPFYNDQPFSDDLTVDSPDMPPAAPLPHALKAIKVARPTTDTLSSSLLTDIGFIASWDTLSAYTYRTTPIPDSAHAIQPYAQLRLRHSGLWHVLFEIYDAGGTLLFQRESETYLEQGRHLIMPPARLRLQKTLRVSTWTLNIRVNGDLLAQHRFTWSADLVDGFIQSDGEIDEDYLQRIEDLPARALTMDELLSMPTSEVKPRTLPP